MFFTECGPLKAEERKSAFVSCFINLLILTYYSRLASQLNSVQSTAWEGEAKFCVYFVFNMHEFLFDLRFAVAMLEDADIGEIS